MRAIFEKTVEPSNSKTETFEFLSNEVFQRLISNSTFKLNSDTR
jgi:hypothetical protein